jgi:GNAT superfamily N-acetyltransferase
VSDAPGASLVIRPAQVDDAALILQLICELADYERLGHEVTATIEQVRASLFGVTPHAEALLAEVGGATAGYALYFHNYSTFHARRGLYLEDLFVRPEFRRRGIGKQLLAHLAATAVARGCARFEWAVLDWNTPSIDFYRTLGAVPQQDWTVFRLDGAALQHLADESPQPASAQSAARDPQSHRVT